MGMSTPAVRKEMKTCAPGLASQPVAAPLTSPLRMRWPDHLREGPATPTLSKARGHLLKEGEGRDGEGHLWSCEGREDEGHLLKEPRTSLEHHNPFLNEMAPVFSFPPLP